MYKKIKVGDIILVEQAWEDQTGSIHDEYAEVLAIDKNGFMKLKFDTQKITDFLDGVDFHIDDYEPEIL